MAQCWLRSKKIFTTDGCRPRFTTRFYNGFGVDSMYMTTEGMDQFSFARGTRDSLTTWRSLPPHVRSLLPYTLTTLIITPRTGLNGQVRLTGADASCAPF